MKIQKSNLTKLYLKEKKSVRRIADELKCSEGRINYWIAKYGIKKRTISEAIYLKSNPTGDPFAISDTKSREDAFLLGLGLGLYWGEGNKKNLGSIRIGNSDPALIRAFLFFLENRFQIQRHRLRFGLQVFTDMNHERAKEYWATYLRVNTEQFYKTVVTVSGKVGTYKEKTKYGVLTLYFHNKKLRDYLVGEIDKLKKIDYYADVLRIEEKPM